MTDCGWLSDRIPAVALGRAEWTKQELQHLQECRACQREWEVVRATSRIDQHPDPVIDPEVVAARVLGRLRTEAEPAPSRRRTWAMSGLAAAAAIMLAIWMGNGKPVATTGRSGSVATAQLEIPLPELESLQAAELDTMLQTLDQPSDLRDPGDEGEPDLTDLNSDELQRVLDTWEG